MPNVTMIANILLFQDGHPQMSFFSIPSVTALAGLYSYTTAVERA